MGLFNHDRKKQSLKRDVAVLALRLTAGGLLAGHGAQKLFGSFGGPGLEGTTGMVESMGFKPGEQWALMGGVSEFGGGLLTALGLFHPIGPIATVGAMGVAVRHAHWGKPIWVTEGGAELPVTNIAIAAALSLVNPGRYSLDRMLGLRVPTSLTVMAAAAVALGFAASEQVAQSPATENPSPDESSEA